MQRISCYITSKIITPSPLFLLQSLYPFKNKKRIPINMPILCTIFFFFINTNLLSTIFSPTKERKKKLILSTSSFLRRKKNTLSLSPLFSVHYRSPPPWFYPRPPRRLISPSTPPLLHAMSEFLFLGKLIYSTIFFERSPNLES